MLPKYMELSLNGSSINFNIESESHQYTHAQDTNIAC